MPTVYLSIGNSDDKLSQAEWAGYISSIDEAVTPDAEHVHGRWFSNPADPWQNACWCLTYNSIENMLIAQNTVTEIRKFFRQDSAAWAIAETQFI